MGIHNSRWLTIAAAILGAVLFDERARTENVLCVVVVVAVDAVDVFATFFMMRADVRAMEAMVRVKY